MTVFRNFEEKALRLLLADCLPKETLEAVLSHATLESYEYTGVGYFLEAHHPSLPVEHATCHEPHDVGEANGVLAGFLAFLGGHKLTLECHSWGGSEVPPEFRDQQVQVSIVTISETAT